MGWRSRYFRISCVDVRENCRDGAMNEVGSQAIEVFTGWISIPIKAGDGITVVSYALVECCPVSARMCDTGGPFLLKGFGVLGHILFI